MIQQASNAGARMRANRLGILALAIALIVPFLAAAQSRPEQITVYVTKTGEKYHRGDCRHLRQSKIAMSLDEAAKRYGPCSVCDPPELPPRAPPQKKPTT
jgi:tRNA/tmRNA/rRNA uracil-C5-methylase (TrmA/RlmC/RlmD family)